jgi:hypothetical protein
LAREEREERKREKEKNRRKVRERSKERKTMKRSRETEVDRQKGTRKWCSISVWTQIWKPLKYWCLFAAE